jgi:hypothetical protein
MRLNRTRSGPRWREAIRLLETLLPLALVTALAAAPMLLLASLLPATLTLPVLSLASIAVAALVALFAWSIGARRDGERVTSWDVAGAFTFIGCAAAMLTESEYAFEYLLGSRNK